MFEFVEGGFEEGAVQGNVLQAVLDPLEALAHLCLQAQHTAHTPWSQADKHWCMDTGSYKIGIWNGTELHQHWQQHHHHHHCRLLPSLLSAVEVVPSVLFAGRSGGRGNNSDGNASSSSSNSGDSSSITSSSSSNVNTSYDMF